MPEIEGTVVLVQEGRLQLLDGHGAGHLVILGRSNAAETQQLYALPERQARVRVTYATPKHVIGLLAQKIELLDEESPA